MPRIYSFISLRADALFVRVAEGYDDAETVLLQLEVTQELPWSTAIAQAEEFLAQR